MKIRLIILCLWLGACQNISIPEEFKYQEIQTRNFTLASWQKITNPSGKYKIYIEGDGHAFNHHGRPTNNPTPKGDLVRQIAFGDKNENVIYLARPCQFVKSPICSQRHWTTARFSVEIIQAEFEAVQKIAGKNPVVLVGFSGGAQVVGLIASAKFGLNVQKIITIAGNLDHLAWTQELNLPPLNESMNLEGYRQRFLKIPQIHYVGENDEIIPPHLVKNFVGSDAEVVEVKNATHHHGWEKIYPLIQKE